MANLPATVPEAPSPTESRMAEALAEQIHRGKTPAEVAKAVHPHDVKARKRLRERLKYMVESDVLLADRLGKKAQAELIMGLGTASRALVRRAAKGNPQALKLLFEASGFHNPRVKHDHSGEITVKVEGMARPDPVTNEAQDIVDADVVE